MKRWILLPMVVFFLLPLQGWGQTAKWTFMVYLAADNDLEPFGISDFNEMETVGSTGDVQIIVQMDRVPGYDASNGDWTDTRRYRVTKDNDRDVISSPVVQNIGEANMGDPQTLIDFVNWAKQTYPAEHYCLVLWNHGGGWRLQAENYSIRPKFPVSPISQSFNKEDLLRMKQTSGTTRPSSIGNPFRSGWGPSRDVCLDKTDNDRLMSSELEQAFKAIGIKFDIVGFDACLMAMIENAYEIRTLADYMVASEETEPGDGWPYDLVLGALSANPNMTPAELSKTIAQKYGEYYSNIPSTKETFSALDLAKLQSLFNRVNDFALAVRNDSVWNQMSQAVQNTDNYNQNQHIDLRDFASKLKGLVAIPAITSAATNLENTIDSMVIQNYNESGHSGAHGVAIYFPPASDYDPRYANGELSIDFSRDGQWDELIRAYYQGGTSQNNVDPYEPNDTFGQAYGPVTSGSDYAGYMTSRTDLDFYKFVTGGVFDCRVDLTVPADYDIYMFRKEGGHYVILDSSINMGTQPENIQRNGLPAGEYYLGILYPYNNDNFSSSPYHLSVTINGGGGNVNLVLLYDDGSPEYGIYSDRQDINEAAASYFTPPVLPASLTGFSYYIYAKDAVPGNGNDGSFYAFGVDYYGWLLPDTFKAVMQVDTGWNFVDLSADNITLYGDFFTGMMWDRWNTPAVGWDTTSTNGLNLVYTDSAGITDWYLWQGTFFIRAHLSYLNAATGVRENVTLSPKKYSLAQNYPNPFNPSTTIRYELRQSSQVTLAVYNIAGQRIATLVNGRQESGMHAVKFERSSLPSGVYFYRLDAVSSENPGKTFTQVRKMVVLK